MLLSGLLGVLSVGSCAGSFRGGFRGHVGLSFFGFAGRRTRTRVWWGGRSLDLSWTGWRRLTFVQSPI